MARRMFIFGIGVLAANAGLASADELCDEQCQASSSAGRVLLQKGTHSTLLHADAAPAQKSTLGTDLPAWLLNKMILPDPWKCPFYQGDWRICDETDIGKAGLQPLAITPAGFRSHEFINYPRVFMPLGTVPCCPTPPFCSSPKCADSFVTTSISAPPATCTKRSGAENFNYMTGQLEWPAYMAYCGGYSFDVHKHWDVLGRILGCTTGHTCTSAETFDLVIDLGSNFGMVTEELTNRHFAKSYIEIDAAPFAGPDFNRRHGDKAWRERWIKEQVPLRPQAVVPDYEFHEFGVTNITGTIDLCMKLGYGKDYPDFVSCPVEKTSPDAIIPARLSEDFKVKFNEAQSAFVKIDVEGYDALAVQGMTNLLRETRGVHPDGSPKHLINFMMVEYAPVQMATAKVEEHLDGDYNLKTMTALFESNGFEVFLTGPRYLPLTHGSWNDQYSTWLDVLGAGSTAPQCPMGTMYPNFKDVACPSSICDCSFATDLFAMRATHPKAAEIKVALGACTESKEFDFADPQYDMSPAAQV